MPPATTSARAFVVATVGLCSFAVAQSGPSSLWFLRQFTNPATPRSRAILTQAPAGSPLDSYYGFGRGPSGNILDQWLRDASGGWTPLTTTQRPTHPVGGGAAFDPTRQVIVYFGGDTGTTGAGELWEFNGTDWTLRTLPVLPPPPPSRRGCTATWVPPLSRVLIVGGFAGPSNLPLGDVWGWNGTTFQGYPALPSTARRGDHAAVSQPGNWNVVIFGGSDGTSLRNDTWVLNVTTLGWTQTATSNPPPARMRATMAADPDTGHVWLFGGQGTSGTLADTWLLDAPGWTSTNPPIATVPPARAGAAGRWADQGMLVVGGETGTGGFLGDTWELVPDVARARRFGVGCGTPMLTVVPTNRPRLGTNFDCTVNGIPGFLHFMMVGLSDATFGGAPLPLQLGMLGAPSCTLYQDAAVSTSAAINLTVPPATFVSSTALPNLPAFAGFVFYLQPWAADLATTPLTIRTGDAVRATVGTF